MSEIEAALAIWERSSEVNAGLWALHLFVVLAALGIAFTNNFRCLNSRWRVALAFLFLNIAIVNGWSIWDNLALYNTAIEVLQSVSGGSSLLTTLTDRLHRIDAGHLLAIHVLLNIGVVCALVLKPASKPTTAH